MVCRFSAFGVQRGDFVQDCLWGAVSYGFVAVGVFHREVEGRLVDGFGVDSPGFGGVGEGFLELDEFGEVVVVERIGFAEVAAGIELVVPDFARWARLFRKRGQRS